MCGITRTALRWLLLCVVASFVGSRAADAVDLPKVQELQVDATGITKSLLEPLPVEERIEQYRDMALLASARFMFGADEATLARWVGPYGVARRGFNADTSLPLYGPGRMCMLAPDFALVLVPSTPAKPTRQTVDVAPGVTLSNDAFVALVRQIDERYLVSGKAPETVYVVGYTLPDEPAGTTIALTYIGSVPGTELYSSGRNGFLRSTIGTRDQLDQFFSNIDELVEARFPADGKVELAGRRLPGAPRLGVNANDWEAFARVYDSARKRGLFGRFQRPGFSLDPFLDVQALKSGADNVKGLRLKASIDGADAVTLNSELDAVAKAVGDTIQNAGTDRFVSTDDIDELARLEDNALSSANDENLRAEARLAYEDFSEWIRDIIDKSTVSAARYDGGTFTFAGDAILSEGLRHTEVGMTYFYADYMTKYVTTHQLPIVKTTLGLLTLPEVDGRFPLDRYPEISEGIRGRLWLEPSKSGYLVGSAGAVRFASHMVRLLEAQETGRGLERKEVNLPPDFVETFARFERYYDDISAAEPQMWRFRELMKLQVLFEAAFDHKPNPVSLTLIGMNLDRPPQNAQRIMNSTWLKANTTQGLETVLTFMKREDGGTETLSPNAAEEISYSWGGQEWSYRGIGNAEAKDIAARRVDEAVQQNLQKGDIPPKADLQKSSADELVFEDLGWSIKLDGAAATMKKTSNPGTEVYTGVGMDIAHGEGDREIARSIKCDETKVVLSETESGSLTESITMRDVKPGIVAVDVVDGEAARAGLLLRDLETSIKQGKTPSCILGEFKDANRSGVLVAVRRTIGDGGDQASSLASFGYGMNRTDWFEARVVDEKSQIEVVRNLPAGMLIDSHAWNSLQRVPKDLVFDDAARKALTRGSVRVTTSFLGTLRVDAHDGRRIDIDEWADMAPEKAQAVTPSVDGRIVLDVSELDDSDVEAILGYRYTLERKLGVTVDVEFTRGADTAICRLLRTRLNADLAVLADTRAMEAAGGVGPGAAKYLSGIPASAVGGGGIGRIRVLSGEAANGPDAIQVWMLMAKKREFAGEIVWVAYCPEKLQDLIGLARAAREGGAIGVVLPDRTLHMDATVLAVNKIRQLQANPEMMKQAQTKLGDGASSEDLVRLVHELVAADLGELKNIPGMDARGVRAKAVLGIIVPGQAKADVRVTDEFLKDLSDDALDEMIIDLRGGKDPAGDDRTGDKDRIGGLSMGPIDRAVYFGLL